MQLVSNERLIDHMNHNYNTTLIMSVLVCIILLSSIPILLELRSPAKADFIPEPNPPGFDAPDPEKYPNYNCPPGYFFEGNHEYINGPGRCTLMTCQNHSYLCTDSNTGTQQVPSTVGTSCSYTVPDPPSLVPQDQICYDLTCWASTLTMMLSYRDHQSYSVDAVLKALGQVYVDKYNNNKQGNDGLSFDEFIQISSRLGLTGFSGASDPDQIRSMLQSYGPLMVVAPEDPNNPGALHARLIIGISADCNDPTNDNTELIMLDPSNLNNGNPISELFDTFNQKSYASSNGGVWMHL